MAKQRKSVFYFSKKHQRHLWRNLGIYSKDYCKLDDGRVLPFTDSAPVGEEFKNTSGFNDYECLGEGVWVDPSTV